MQVSHKDKIIFYNVSKPLKHPNSNDRMPIIQEIKHREVVVVLTMTLTSNPGPA